MWYVVPAGRGSFLSAGRDPQYGAGRESETHRHAVEYMVLGRDFQHDSCLGWTLELSVGDFQDELEESLYHEAAHDEVGPFHYHDSICQNTFGVLRDMTARFEREAIHMTWSKLIAATALALGATSALVQGSGAQQAAPPPPDEAGAIYAVVNMLYEQLIANGHLQPGGTIAITPHRIALQARLPRQRPRFERGRAVGNKLRMRLADFPGARITIGELDSIVVCATRFPPSCSLNGADAVISFSEVTGTGRTATVVARVVHPIPGDTHQPVHTFVVTIELVREDSRWVVSSQTIIMIT